MPEGGVLAPGGNETTIDGILSAQATTTFTRSGVPSDMAIEAPFLPAAGPMNFQSYFGFLSGRSSSAGAASAALSAAGSAVV